MSKWTLEFEESEVEILVAALDHGSKCTEYPNNKDEITKTLDKFTKTIKSEKYIKHHVFITLASFGSKKYQKITEKDNLRLNLNITFSSQKSLREPFQKILEELNSQNKITVKECEELETVSECIDLLRSKI